MKVWPMGKISIKLSPFFVFLLFNITFTSTMTGAETNKVLSLSQNTKDLLIKSNPVLGKKVTKATFLGKPILITFFASWWGSCRAEFVQLGNFLNNGGIKKVNIIAINWKEERGGKASINRLNNLVRTFHPNIRVIRSNQEIETHFAPLTNVPMSFIFNKRGQLIYGSGKQEYLGIKKLSKILNSIP